MGGLVSFVGVPVTDALQTKVRVITHAVSVKTHFAEPIREPELVLVNTVVWGAFVRPDLPPGNCCDDRFCAFPNTDGPSLEIL